MQRHIGRLIPALLLGALLALGQGRAAAAASPTATPAASGAQRTPSTEGTLNVSPPLIFMSVAPGGTATTEITLHADSAQDVTLEADGLSQEPDGSFQGLAATDDKSPFSARSMMTVTPDKFQIPAGGSQTVKVSVSVPKGAGDGARYAIVDVTGVPVSGQSVGIGVRLGVSSVITLSDTKQTRTGKITDLTINQGIPGQPLPVTATLVTTGNSHFGAAPNLVNTSATVRDSRGKVVVSGRITMTGNSVVPTFGRQFSIPLGTSRPLDNGTYQVEVGASLQDGNVLDRETLQFDVSSGSLLGATAAPNRVPPASNSQGSDGGMMLISGLLAGLLAGAACVGAFALRSRRKLQRMASQSSDR